MSTPTIESLNNQVQTFKRQLSDFENRMDTLESRMDIMVTKAELNTTINNFNDQMSDFNNALAVVEEKVKNVLLPENTRYYLKVSEISDFRANFRTLRAMMASLDRSRQAFVRLAAKYNLTNSQV